MYPQFAEAIFIVYISKEILRNLYWPDTNYNIEYDQGNHAQKNPKKAY